MSDITSLGTAALACREIAQEASDLQSLAEQIVVAGSNNGMDVTDMDAGREDLTVTAQLWNDLAARYESAANAARDAAQANVGNIGRDLSWSGRAE